MKFKPGDKVKCLDPFMPVFTQIGTVREVTESTGYCEVEFAGPARRRTILWRIYEDNLEPVKETATTAGESYRLELLDETRRPLACFDFDSWGDAIDFAQVCLANGHKVVLGKE